MNLLKASTEDFVERMRSQKLQRAYLVTDKHSGTVEPSHELLRTMADTVATDRDYAAHEACFFEIGEESGHLMSAHIHWTMRGQAAGGVRFWSYDSLESFVRDGLRLSRGMGQKCALAGLWWGGGKGVIARRKGSDHRDQRLRKAVYRDYGRFVSGLRGCYVTAEDVGTTPEDMASIFETSRYTTCVPKAVGGSGNPSVLTARGVVVAMEAALQRLGKGDLVGKTIAVQGLGNVSTYMIHELLGRGVARVIGCDVDETAVERVHKKWPEDSVSVHVVSADDVSIFEETCDVLAPNAVGATINSRSIPLVKAPIVCGGANNQLEESARDGDALRDRGILYVPDFLANRMGIVNCSNEQYGAFDNDPMIDGHFDQSSPAGIHQRCMEVFDRAEKNGMSTAAAAEQLADKLSQEPHPLWGHRGRQIIDHLVQSGWSTQPVG